ncbi:mediator of RNA polymerase II transcription subunit 15a-like isoform X1 [Triticum dicoccoides]|uniref:mediator of RNA polymerase II transcription subunit 15a-like isoform X1 n=1 Tax=Triticum dicoccoides TaxID=85692 RepID=UPI00188EDFCC|nr:mediator of RNA polymerase II transcription subunit 15a-like isoform X1 [Triticum dicoccoides]
MASTGGDGGRHWLDDEAPDLRSRIRQTLTSKLARYYQPRYAPDSQEAQRFVANFEEVAFRGTNSKEDYMRNISSKLLIMEKKTSGLLERRMQSRSQSRLANTAQALQGGNPSVRPEAGMMATPGPTSQPMTPQTSGLVPNQHMVYPRNTNLQTEVEQKHPGVMTILDQRPKFQPKGITTVGPGVSLWQMQSGANQSQSQHASRQAQTTNFVGCSPPSVSKTAGGPNSLQNHLLGQNGSSVGKQQPQLTRMNQQSSRADQQETDMQKYQMLGAQQTNISKMQPSQLGGCNNQKDTRQTNLLRSPVEASEHEPMAPPLQQIAGAQQSTLLCQSSQNTAMMGSAREYDLIEGMFSQIKSWKDAYFSQFVELERRVVIPTLTEEQFLSLPAAKANEYKRKAYAKRSIRKILNFLLLEKSDVNEGLKLDFPKYKEDVQKLVAYIERGKAHNAEMNTGHQLRNCREQPQVINLTGNASSISGGKSRQQKQPADTSILQSRQTNMARTPPPHEQSNGNHLLGIASPFSSPGSLPSCSSSLLESLTPSPVANPVIAPASRCDPLIPMDVDSISAFLLHGNSAAPAPKANGSNQVTPTKPTLPASPRQADIAAGQAEVQAGGGDRTPVTEKPIDRLMAAIRSSSPAALRSSANSIWSVLSISDTVPHGQIGTILDDTSSQQQWGGPNTARRMKRVFNHTAAHSESLPLGSMDGSCMTFECDASDSGSSSEQNIKRAKTQNANDALLKEIKSINDTLIDTVVSISMDGIAPYDGGTTIKLSYSAVSLSPTVKSLIATSGMSLVLPVKLFVPADYPSSSPVPISDGGDEVPRRNSSAISASVDVAFRHALRGLLEPWSIEAVARAWDACVRKAVTQFAHRLGGGTVNSIFGGWERCAAA